MNWIFGESNFEIIRVFVREILKLFFWFYCVGVLLWIVVGCWRIEKLSEIIGKVKLLRIVIIVNEVKFGCYFWGVWGKGNGVYYVLWIGFVRMLWDFIGIVFVCVKFVWLFCM